jgi:hypothetical protein
MSADKNGSEKRTVSPVGGLVLLFQIRFIRVYPRLIMSDAKNQLPKANCRKSARLQLSNMQRVDNDDEETVRVIQAAKVIGKSELTNETDLEKEWI